MDLVDAFECCLDDFSSLFNEAKNYIAEKVVDVVPGWSFRFHAVWQYRKMFYFFLDHVLSNVTFYQAYDH